MPLTVLAALAMLLGGIPLGGTVASAQQTVTIARLLPDKTVELLNLPEGRWHRVYRASSWGLTDLSVAPTGDRLAFLSWTEGVVSRGDYSVPPSAELVVIDTSGRKLAAFPSVQRYAWCGPGSIAYIIGEYREEKHPNFRADGVGLLDVGTGATRAVRGPQYPSEVVCRPSERAAYLKNSAPRGEPRIYRLDVDHGTIAPTGLLDNEFSPTGRFYIERPPEGGGESIVRRTADNSEVPLEKLRRGADLIGWAGGDRDLLLAVKHEPRTPGSDTGGVRVAVGPMNPPLTYLLYDLDRQQVVRSQRGRLWTYANQHHQPILQLPSGWHIFQ
jgi:hypothetical protein